MSRRFRSRHGRRAGGPEEQSVPEPVAVRPAAPGDVEALLRVKARSWREAYGALLPSAAYAARSSAVIGSKRLARWLWCVSA